MLRYNEERNLIGFKYNNRSIRIFPVFEEKDLNKESENDSDDMSSEDLAAILEDRVEETEEVEWDSNQVPNFKNGKKVDVQELANTPQKVRSKSEHDNPSSTGNLHSG